VEILSGKCLGRFLDIACKVTIKVVVCGCMLVTFVVTCLLHYALQLADVTDCVNCLVKVC